MVPSPATGLPGFFRSVFFKLLHPKKKHIAEQNEGTKCKAIGNAAEIDIRKN